MTTPRIWTLYPGHVKDDTPFYGWRIYRGMHVEVWEKEPGVFVWSFYDDLEDAHAMAVARSDDTFSSVNDAATDAEDYIDGWL